jgi:hypothetical protein
VADPRIEQYARLLVERCVDIQPGWEVVVVGSTHARPLIEEIIRAIGRRKAIPVVQLTFSGMDYWPFETVWAETAPPSSSPSVRRSASRSKTSATHGSASVRPRTRATGSASPRGNTRRS